MVKLTARTCVGEARENILSLVAKALFPLSSRPSAVISQTQTGFRGRSFAYLSMVIFFKTRKLDFTKNTKTVI